MCVCVCVVGLMDRALDLKGCGFGLWGGGGSGCLFSLTGSEGG